MKKSILCLIFLICILTLEAQFIMQTALGAHLNFTESSEFRYSLEGSISIPSFPILTFNTGVLSDAANGIPQDFFMDFVVWYGVGAGFGFEFDASRSGAMAPYFVLTEILPIFEEGTLRPAHIFPVFGCKWTYWPEGTEFSIFVRLKFLIIDY